jgi:hypothetical protein
MFLSYLHRRALPLEPDPDLDPYLTRFINVLHAHNEGRGFAGPDELREALFPAWKSMVRPPLAAADSTPVCRSKSRIILLTSVFVTSLFDFISHEICVHSILFTIVVVPQLRERWSHLPLRVADPSTADRVAILIEPRADADLPALIRHMMWMLNYPHANQKQNDNEGVGASAAESGRETNAGVDPSHSYAYNEIPPNAPAPRWALHIIHSPNNAALLMRGLNLTRDLRSRDAASASSSSSASASASACTASAHSPATCTVDTDSSSPSSSDLRFTPPVTLTMLPHLTRGAYSGLTTSAAFHSLFRAEHFLVFQNDVAALRPDALDEFLDFDYVGAPWCMSMDVKNFLFALLAALFLSMFLSIALFFVCIAHLYSLCSASFHIRAQRGATRPIRTAGWPAMAAFRCGVGRPC